MYEWFSMIAQIYIARKINQKRGNIQTSFDVRLLILMLVVGCANRRKKLSITAACAGLRIFWCDCRTIAAE